MNCPRCQKYIVPEFYCINCGHVPAKMQDPDLNNITGLKIPIEPHWTVRQQASLSPALFLSTASGHLAQR